MAILFDASRPAKSSRRPRPVHGVCSLTLRINGTAYRVKPVACDPEAALRCYELRKADGTVYCVSHHPHGSECTCPDWVFSRDGIDPAGCKHIKALVALGMLPYPVPSAISAPADDFPRRQPRPRPASGPKRAGRPITDADVRRHGAVG